MLRIFDIFLSSTALIILLPFGILIVFALKLSGEGEIFYLQERIGRSGKVFKLFKFATMLKNSPNLETGTITIKDDTRILPLGKILRKTKINELPQLINIFFGHMSFIGPRPLTKQTFNAYSNNIQNIIKSVRPGLSGLGSIFFRNEEEMMSGKDANITFYNFVIAPYKGALEEYYILNKGVKLYFLAIGLTLWVVLYPKSSLQWRVFKNLPKPPSELKSKLNHITD